MARWTDLSKETLVNIFNNLIDNDKGNCLLVCKQWQDAAYTSIYNDKLLFFNEEQLIEFINLKSPIGKYVRRTMFFLTWTNETTPRYNQLMESFANKVPNLLSITEGRTNRNWYIWILSDKISYPNRWPNLQYIAPPIEPSCIEFYNACVLKYSKTLKDLRVGDQTYTTPRNLFFVQEYEQLANRLSEFPCLTELCLLKQAKERNIQSFDSLLPLSLKSITIKLYGVPGYLKENYIDLKNVLPLSKVKHVDLSIMPADDDSLLYIMRKFNNTRDFKLDVSSQKYGIEGFFEDFPADFSCHRYSAIIVVKFLEYVFSKHRYQLVSFYVDKLFDILDLLPTHRLDTIGINYTQRDKYEITADAAFESDYFSDIPDILQRNNGFPTSIRILNHELHVPFIERYGKLIRRLLIDGKFDISSSSSSSLSPDFNTGQYLDHIFKQCPKLTLLGLKDHTLLKCDLNLIKSKSIEELRLRDMKLYKDIFYELSVRLPKLHVLSLDNCQYLDFHKRPVKTKQVLIDMPYTVLRSLEIRYDSDHQELSSEFFILFKISTFIREKYYAVRIIRNSSQFTLLPLTRDAYLHFLPQMSSFVNYVIQVRLLRTITFIYKNEFAAIRYVSITLQ